MGETFDKKAWARYKATPEYKKKDAAWKADLLLDISSLYMVSVELSWPQRSSQRYPRKTPPSPSMT